MNHNAKATDVKNFGWYVGNPALLHRLPQVEASKRYVEAMGGADADKAQGKNYHFNLDFTDTKEKRLLKIWNSVLDNYPEKSASDATASLTLSRATLNRIVAGKMKAADAISIGDIEVEGDKDAFMSLLTMLDRFDPWYNLITP